MFYNYLITLVDICCYLGIVINAILIYISSQYSKNMGLFQYFIMIFSGFEMCFAILVLLAKPAFLGFEHRLMVLSQNTWLAPSFAELLTGLYCSFYQIWLGLVVALFVYKYLIMCRPHIAQTIKDSIMPKILLCFIYLLHVSYAFVCGVLWCTRNKPTTYMKQRIRILLAEYLNQTEDTFEGIVMAIFNDHNEINMAGILTVLDHFVLISVSFTVIVFCGIQIWRTICCMAQKCHLIKYKQTARTFYVIVIQAAVPFAMYTIPTALFMGDAVLEGEPVLIDWIPLWSLLMSLPNVIDPIIILFMIKDYRSAVKEMFLLHLKTNVSSPVSQARVMKDECKIG